MAVVGLKTNTKSYSTIANNYRYRQYKKKYPDVMFPGAMWDRAVATSFPARERGVTVKRARTSTCIGLPLRLSSCDQHNGSLAKMTHWTTDHN